MWTAAGWRSAGLSAALVWMIGAMAVGNVRLSFINFIALPITFGIGVDYPVNIYGRYAQERGRGVLEALRGAGGPVILCSLTTSLGYLALLLALVVALSQLTPALASPFDQAPRPSFLGPHGIEIADIVDAANTYAVFVWGPERVKVEYVEHKPTFSLT